MSRIGRAYLLLHLSIVLWGFTAVIGDLISLSAGVLVWWRVAITSGLLLLWPPIRLEISKMSRTTMLKYIWVGVLVGLHWVCFFGSIKFANASVALITMSTTALFTALLEPSLLHIRLKKMDVGLSLLVIPVMILTASGFEGDMVTGFWLGIIAAILLAYFTILNKKWISDVAPSTITFIEMSAACIFLTLMSPILLVFEDSFQLIPSGLDSFYLIILSIGCTILPFILHLIALKDISAFATNLVINLEPVYGLILAALILNEYQELDANFYLGAFLIIAIIFTYPFLKRNDNRFREKNNESIKTN